MKAHNYPTPFDTVGQIIAYEEGELDEDETVGLFQHLVDNGQAWSLQGSYGRTATDLINAGLVTPVQRQIAGADVYEEYDPSLPSAAELDAHPESGW